MLLIPITLYWGFLRTVLLANSLSFHVFNPFFQINIGVQSQTWGRRRNGVKATSCDVKIFSWPQVSWLYIHLMVRV